MKRNSSLCPLIRFQIDAFIRSKPILGTEMGTEMAVSNASWKCCQASFI